VAAVPPQKITSKRNSDVLVSQGDGQATQDTLFLISIPGMREFIQSGMKAPTSKCDKYPSKAHSTPREV
jgi:hypothetical protein